MRCAFAGTGPPEGTTVCAVILSPCLAMQNVSLRFDTGRSRTSRILRTCVPDAEIFGQLPRLSQKMRFRLAAST